MLEIICEFRCASGWYLFIKVATRSVNLSLCVLSICMLVYITLRLVLQCCVPERDVLCRRFG